jgi:hypothetical protein
MAKTPMTRQAVLDLARAQLAAGRFEGAIQLVMEVVKAGHVEQDTMSMLQHLAEIPRCLPAAIQILGAAIQQRPQSALPPYTLARILHRQRQLPKAIDLLEEAVRRRPAFDEAHDFLQELRLAVGRPHTDASVSVIMPTTGHPDFRTALRSVLQQDHPNVDVMVVADGPEAAGRLRGIAGDLLEHPSVVVFPLPYNVGAGLFNGHRVYASMPALARGRWVAFLDQDNAWAPDHLSRMVNLVACHRLQWASCLRVVCDSEGRVLRPDDCENIHPWDAITRKRMNDTSAYLVRTDIAVRAAAPWYARYRDAESPDIAFGQHLHRQFPRTASTGAYTLYYRIGRADSLPEWYFTKGNQTLYEKHGNPPPWRKAPPPAVGTPMPGSDSPNG